MRVRWAVRGGLPKRLLPEFQRERGLGTSWAMAVVIDTEEPGQKKTDDFLRAGSTWDHQHASHGRAHVG